MEKKAQRCLNGFLTTVLDTPNHLCAGLGLPEELNDQFRAEFHNVHLDAAVVGKLQDLRETPLVADFHVPPTDPGRYGEHLFQDGLPV